MQEKHKVMGEVVRKLWLDQERCVYGICKRWLFWEAAGKSRGCLWAVERSCWQGKAKGSQSLKPGRRGWPEHGAKRGGWDLAVAQLGRAGAKAPGAQPF